MDEQMPRDGELLPYWDRPARGLLNCTHVQHRRPLRQVALVSIRSDQPDRSAAPASVMGTHRRTSTSYRVSRPSIAEAANTATATDPSSTPKSRTSLAWV